MGLLAASVVGLVFWIIAWALGAKALDAFLVTIAIFLIAATVRVIRQNLPSYRGDDAADQARGRRAVG